jgi:hypothetical protein
MSAHRFRPLGRPHHPPPTSSGPSPASGGAARGLPTATLHEAGGKIGALPSAIKPVAARHAGLRPGRDRAFAGRRQPLAAPGPGRGPAR